MLQGNGAVSVGFEERGSSYQSHKNSKAGKLELNWIPAPRVYQYTSETQRCVPTRQDRAVLKSASAFHAPAAVMGSVSRAPATIRRATSVSSCPWCLQPSRPDLLAHRDLRHALLPEQRPSSSSALPDKQKPPIADAADLVRDLTAWSSSSGCCSAPRARGVAQAMPRHRQRPTPPTTTTSNDDSAFHDVFMLIAHGRGRQHARPGRRTSGFGAGHVRPQSPRKL